VNLLDANILLYAYDRSSPHNADARKWLETALSGLAPIAFCWPTILAFLRIATHRKAMARPLAVADARKIVESWLEQPISTIVAPTERHWAILSSLLISGQASGALVSDAHLAALAIEHGATLVTNDRDFARFPGLDVEYPLMSAG
jgi:toxin-antitoxin system PIN domain toxin